MKYTLILGSTEEVWSPYHYSYHGLVEYAEWNEEIGVDSHCNILHWDLKDVRWIRFPISSLGRMRTTDDSK